VEKLPWGKCWGKGLFGALEGHEIPLSKNGPITAPRSSGRRSLEWGEWEGKETRKGLIERQRIYVTGGGRWAAGSEKYYDEGAGEPWGGRLAGLLIRGCGWASWGAG